MLLRIACMGNAEKTIQGELFHQLRFEHNLNAVIECGYRDVDEFDEYTDRHIDIMVFDHDWLPIVAIELKHYSPHQGTINPLLGALEADYNKLRPEGLPLIQIGLYTEINAISHPIQKTSSLLRNYRFFTSYVLPGFKNIRDAMEEKLSKDRHRVSTWAWPKTKPSPYSKNTGLVRVRPDNFSLGSSSDLVVTGRVNWMGLLAP